MLMLAIEEGREGRDDRPCLRGRVGVLAVLMAARRRLPGWRSSKALRGSASGEGSSMLMMAVSKRG